MDQQSLCTFVATSAYLYLKMMSNTGIQAFARMRSKAPKYAEDKMFFGGEYDPEERPSDLQRRGTACWSNDLENIPMFLLAAMCGLMAGVPQSVYLPLCVAFCAARTVHSICLVLGWQPWRFFGYAAGVVSTGAMFVISLRQFGW